MTTDDKIQTLKIAGWKIKRLLFSTYYHPPRCARYYSNIDDAWQAYLRNERCEQPLVKEQP